MKVCADDIHERARDGKNGAVFSDCQSYRYLLYRFWDKDRTHRVAFVGLNPSTADATKDDATIRRCIGFAKRWGYSGLFMLNLFAFRETNPGKMKRQTDPQGEHNVAYLKRYTRRAVATVCCWGVNIDRMDNTIVLTACRAIHPPTYCLGLTKHGYPKHPARLAAGTALAHFDRPPIP